MHAEPEEARYGIAIFHGIGDVLNCTPLARQLKADAPRCHITWFSSERQGFVLENNPDIDELVLLPGDPLELDARLSELEASRPWTRFFTPAPYLNYQKRPGASLHELIRGATGVDYSVPFRSVLRLREEEVQKARAYWTGLPKGPRILMETEFHSEQSHWTDACIFEVFGLLRGVDPLLVFCGRNRPAFLDDLQACGARVAFCQAPLRQVAELYNLSDAFIGVSSGLSCLTLSTHCRGDVPSIEYCRGEHWSTAHWDHPQERTFAYSYPRFLDAVAALAARLGGTPAVPDFGPSFKPLEVLPDGRERIPCPGCGADRAIPVRSHDIVECRACGLTYLRTRKAPPATEAYYATDYGMGSPDAAPAIRTPRDRAEAESDPACLAAGRPDHLAWLLRCTGLAPQGSRALDVGCGWGAWLLACRGQGMQVRGFELSAANVAFAQHVLGLDVRQGQFPDQDLAEDSQDLVTFFHSLEHVPDPVAFLSKAAHVLVPGGWLYVVVPNLESLASAVLGDAWPWIEPEWHQVHFTRKTLLDLIFQAGFQLESLTTATGDFGNEALVELFRSQSPEASTQAITLAIEELGKNGSGEELRLLARKRGGFKGRTLARKPSLMEDRCPVDGRSPLAKRLLSLFQESSPRRILQVAPSDRSEAPTLLAGLVRRHGLPKGSLLCVEDVGPGVVPEAQMIQRAGLVPWVDAWLGGLSLPRGEMPEPIPGVDNRKDDRLRMGLRRHGYRPDLAVLSGEGELLLRQFVKLLSQVEGPCRILLEGTEADLLRLRNGYREDARLEGWSESGGILEVHFDPGLVAAKEPVERILWVRIDAIGDAVLSAGMLPLIHQTYPNADITVLCQEHIAPLYEACPQVVDCLTFSRDGLAQGGPEALQALVNEVGKLDADICLSSVYSRESLADLLVSASGAWATVGVDGDTLNIPEGKKRVNNYLYTTLVPALPDGSELDRNAHFLRTLGIETGALAPRVWTKPEDEAFVEEWLRARGLDGRRSVAVFAGAQSGQRIYSGYGKALAEALGGGDWTVLTLGTQGERALNRSALAGFKGAVHDLCGALTLRQAAALLRRCALAVGAESGLAHIACAVGTPNVVVQGGGHFGRFMPTSPLTTATVLPLSCFLCDWRCPYPKAHCVRDLHPTVLAEAIRETLRSGATKPRLFAQGGDFAVPGGPDLLDLKPILNLEEVELRIVDPESPKLHPSMVMEPRLTVFCGVWHKDPDRLALLKGHEACLKAQTVPVRRLYVFDGGDLPPVWLDSDFVASSRPLALYEAWDLAVQHVRTPFLMNLNLDDRLSTDAAERVLAALDAGADLVGGEWRICFSHEATDATGPSHPAEAVPFFPEWPPVPGRDVRLGSGTGERGTYGPATAWRSAIHQKLPHYPWRFKDGSPVRIIGDAIWWDLLQRAGFTLGRLPWIIGHYHSHPEGQAEFRNPADLEHAKLAEVGIQIL